jgi:hypothetical protein
MSTIKAYEEVIDFIAAGSNSHDVVNFHPSEDARERVAELIEREKSGELADGEKSELDHYLQLEHLMRMAKIRARDYLANE